MVTSCNQKDFECVHMSIWPTKLHAESWTARRLSLECHGYEDTLSHIQRLIQQTAPEPLSENETEYDVQEAEDIMDNVPSPTHRQYSYWNPEYEARRQARKPFQSPPLTPDPDEAWKSSYSLQPSQHSPTYQQRHSPQRISPSCSASRVPEQRQALQHRGIYKRATLLRRPTTRSMKSSKFLSLHSRKGYVEIRSLAGHFHTATFDTCLENVILWSVPLLL